MVGPFPQHYLDLRNGVRDPYSRLVVSPGFQAIVAERIRKGDLKAAD